MTTPQKENGYTAIANEIMEALARIRIPGEARQMLDVVIRKTYGFNKTKDQISTTQFMQTTGLKRFTIARARKRLLLANLITVSKNANSQILSYSFQKDYNKWKVVAKKLTGSKNAPYYKQKSAQTVAIIDTHKRHKYNITKDSSASHLAKSPQLSDEEFIKSLKNNPAYTHINIDIELAKMDAWLSTRQGRKKTRRFVVNWLNKIDKPLETNGKTRIYQ